MNENEKETQELTPEKFAELSNQIAQLTQERDNVVGEIKEDREKRKALQEEIDALKASQQVKATDPAQPAVNDVAEIVKKTVEQTLAERDASIAKSNKVTAVEKFVSEYPAFNAENDPTGKMREALEGKLSMFNTANLKSEEEFYSVVKDAARLLGVDTAPTNSGEKPVAPYASTSKSTSAPRVASDTSITDKEAHLIEQKGLTKERFLELKQKNPEMLERILGYVK